MMNEVRHPSSDPPQQVADEAQEDRPREEEEGSEHNERTHRASGKPLRASPFSWETASRVRAPWRR